MTTGEYRSGTAVQEWLIRTRRSSQPTPAAAPLKVVKGVADVTTCGVLKVVVEESASCSYLACKGDACSLTETVEDALCVRLIPQSGFVVMEAVVSLIASSLSEL